MKVDNLEDLSSLLEVIKSEKNHNVLNIKVVFFLALHGHELKVEKTFEPEAHISLYDKVKYYIMEFRKMVKDWTSQAN